MAHVLNYLKPGDHVVLTDGPAAGITFRVYLFDATPLDVWDATMQTYAKTAGEACALGAIPDTFLYGALYNARFVIIASDASPVPEGVDVADSGGASDMYGMITVQHLSADNGQPSRAVHPHDHSAKLDLVCANGFRKLGIVLIHAMCRMLSTFNYDEIKLQATRPKVASLYAEIGFKIAGEPCRLAPAATDAKTLDEIQAFWDSDSAKGLVVPNVGIAMRLCGIDRVNTYEPMLAQIDKSLMSPAFDFQRHIQTTRVEVLAIRKAVAERDISKIDIVPPSVLEEWVLDGLVDIKALTKWKRIQLAVKAAKLAKKAVGAFTMKATDDEFMLGTVIPILQRHAA